MDICVLYVPVDSLRMAEEIAKQESKGWEIVCVFDNPYRRELCAVYRRRRAIQEVEG